MGILQARILEWVAMPSSRDLPNPGIEPSSPSLQTDSLPSEPPQKPPCPHIYIYIYIYIYESLFYIYETNTILLINYTSILKKRRNKEYLEKSKQPPTPVHNPFTIWFYCSSHQEVKSVPPFPESCFDQQNVVEITLFDFQNLDHQEDLNFRSSPSWNTVLRPSCKEAGLIYWRWKAMWKRPEDLQPTGSTKASCE